MDDAFAVCSPEQCSTILGGSRDTILDGLNEAQKAAVVSRAKVLQVLAPPGSGKTKTLTSRVGYLISEDGLEPRNIVVCTFTVKAAREMQERISGFLGKDKASRLILGTFHSIARRYLAIYGKKIDLDSKFSIADSSDTLGILSRIIKAGDKYTIEAKAARSRISSLKSQGITAESFNLSSGRGDLPEIASIYSQYEEHLRVSKLLDFDDLLLRCTELLRRHPEVVSNVDAVLIDEFQDTNNVQYDLMKLFAQAKENVTIVGDPDQSIYGWRNAEIKNLMKMRGDYPDTHVINLEENYRSSGAILLSAQEVIEQDQSRPAKRLMPTHSVGMRPVLRRLPSAATEALWIVSEMKRSTALTGDLFRWSDYAVLLRSAALSRHIESEFGKAGVPYRMVGGSKFFDRVEVKLVLDYLRVVQHPENDDALARVINVPPRGIGDVTVARLFEYATQHKSTLWSAVLALVQGRLRLGKALPSQAQRGLEHFVNIILVSQNKLQDAEHNVMTLPDIMTLVIERAELQKYLQEKKKEDFESRWSNVQELITQAADMCVELDAAQIHDDDVEGLSKLQLQEAFSTTTVQERLQSFLANVALSSDTQKSDISSESKDQVTISTIHAAKGLEWPAVFIPGAYNGSIPHSRAEDNDEERRLLYVAMTRAQCLLYLSCPAEESNKSTTSLSPFLAQRPMNSYFDKCGSAFGHVVACEMASILRRPAPSLTMIVKAMASMTSIRDDQWPLAGVSADNAHANSKYLRANTARPGNGSSEWQSHQNMRPVDMQNSGTFSSLDMRKDFSISNARFSTFVTANSALKHGTLPSDNRTRSRSRSPEKTMPPSKRQRGQQKASNQGSISTFLIKSNVTSTSSVNSSARAIKDVIGVQEFPDKALNDVTNTCGAATPQVHSEGPSTGTTSIKPATTLHKTSIDSVRHTTGGRALGAKSKSFTGWSDRKHR